MNSLYNFCTYKITIIYINIFFFTTLNCSFYLNDDNIHTGHKVQYDLRVLFQMLLSLYKSNMGSADIREHM